MEINNMNATQTTEAPAQPQHPIITIMGHTGKWSNAQQPHLGDRVKVTMNGLGTGKIVDLFVAHGFLGVVVIPDPGQRPQWHIDQFKRNKMEFKGYRVFGAEIKFL